MMSDFPARRGNVLDVKGLIDEQPMVAAQWMILILCFLVLIADGFDTAAMAFVAPSLMHELGISKLVLGAGFECRFDWARGGSPGCRSDCGPGGTQAGADCVRGVVQLCQPGVCLRAWLRGAGGPSPPDGVGDWGGDAELYHTGE